MILDKANDEQEYLATYEKEQFLELFHDARPSATSNVLSNIAVQTPFGEFNSTYHLLVSTVPSDTGPMAILDLGCGDGWLFDILGKKARANDLMVGIDLSTMELQRAKERSTGRHSYLQARAQQLPFVDRVFDHVFSHMSLMLMDDLDRVVGEICRVLGSGGVLSAILARRGPISDGQKCFLQAMEGFERTSRFKNVSFKSPQLSGEAEIRKLLGQEFKSIEVSELFLPLKLSTIQSWSWFSSMYDLAMFESKMQRPIKKRYLNFVKPYVNSSDQLEHCMNLYFITARKR